MKRYVLLAHAYFQAENAADAAEKLAMHFAAHAKDLRHEPVKHVELWETPATVAFGPAEQEEVYRAMMKSSVLVLDGNNRIVHVVGEG